jgi:hypothetical protein
MILRRRICRHHLALIGVEPPAQQLFRKFGHFPGGIALLTNAEELYRLKKLPVVVNGYQRWEEGVRIPILHSYSCFIVSL